MVEAQEKHRKLIAGALVVAIIVLLSLSVYGISTVRKLRGNGSELSAELETTKVALAEKTAQLENLQAMFTIIEQEYALSEESKAELLAMLTEEKNRNEEFADQIEDATRTVGKLDKLSKLDPELLMKYSKVYFLNEHYTPEKVAQIPEEFTFKKDEPEYIDGKVLPYLENLLEDAEEDGIELLVVSGYRSYDEQKGLKSAYSVQYGTGANTFSADQGYSEHQLGTTVDFSTATIGGSLAGFENTEAYAWLTKYGYKYGFVLSYPEKNGYYIFEPWHWRFVGEDLADDLHDDKKFFYDLDQREIDAYLINIFD